MAEPDHATRLEISALMATYSVPMQDFENTDDVAEELFGYIHGKGKRKKVAKYKEIRTAAKNLLKSKNSVIANNDSIENWDSSVGPFLSSSSLKRDFYKKVPTDELPFLLEALSLTRFSRVTSEYGVDKTLRDLLLSSLASNELKFALACSTYKMRSVALWLCLENRGRLIPALLKTIEETLQKDLRETNAEFVAELLYSAMIIGRNENDRFGARILDNIDKTIITSEILSLLLPKYDAAYYKSAPLSAISRHARRLHGFDESIPDDWVINAIR